MARDGSKRGRRKGSKNLKTLNKEEAREALRVEIMKHAEEMVRAQVANAKGLLYLMAREKNSGKFVRITERDDPGKIGKNEEIIEVWVKDPSVQAFTDLMNRALDKPKEQPQEVAVTVTNLDERIRAARLREQAGKR